MILIDNYDSFTYNIVQYLNKLGVFPRVIKNDEMSAANLEKFNFNSIIISPGPGNPNKAGICMKVIDKFKTSKKIRCLFRISMYMSILWCKNNKRFRTNAWKSV